MLAQVRGNPPISGGVLSLPKTARMEQIERVIAVHQTMQKQGLTMRQIARQIGMSPSDHLMSILWDLAEADRLLCRYKDYRPNIKSFVWFVTPNRLGLVLDQVYGKEAAPAAK